jgi:hypothetical protein
LCGSFRIRVREIVVAANTRTSTGIGRDDQMTQPAQGFLVLLVSVGCAHGFLKSNRSLSDL